jgi:hypothetical protein
MIIGLMIFTVTNTCRPNYKNITNENFILKFCLINKKTTPTSNRHLL